jgi:hypothetical protein
LTHETAYPEEAEDRGEEAAWTPGGAGRGQGEGGGAGGRGGAAAKGEDKVVLLYNLACVFLKTGHVKKAREAAWRAGKLALLVHRYSLD